MNIEKLDSTIDAHAPADVADVVLLTRRRWDWIFGIGTAVTVVLAVVFYFGFEDRSLFSALVGLLPMWFWIRLGTPAASMPTERMFARPGSKPFLGFLALMSLVTTVVTLVDTFVLGQGWHEPLKLYHFAVYPPIIIFSLAGVWFIEKRYIIPGKENRNESTVR